MPVKYYFGYDCIKLNGSEILDFGKKPFIITGKNSAKISGAIYDVEEFIQNNKIKHVVFDKISENPDISDILTAAELFLNSNCDFIIGIGGGSPIDAAKAVSAFSANGFKYREIFNSSNIKKNYPVIAVPTTSGTGTEVTQYTVLSDSKTNIKCGVGSKLLFPSLSFINPVYTLSVPLNVTKDTAVDALSHLLEGIYSNKRNRLCYPLIFEGIKLIIKNLPLCLKEPDNPEFRYYLSSASLYGGLSISQSSTTLQHSIGYPLTTRFGLSHGAANGVVLLEIMNLYYPHIKKELDLLFDILNFTKTDFYNFIESLEYKSNLDILQKKFLNEIIVEVLNSRNMANNPSEFTYSDILNIYKNI